MSLHSLDISITQASHLLDVSVETIRRWEKKGLIKAHRSSQGYRLFNVDELHRFKNKLSGASNEKYEILSSSVASPYSVIELFSGAGGLALGLHHAGLSCRFLVDNNRDAVETIKKNQPSWNAVHSDISDINFKDMKADIVAGGFPCQAFSYAGKRLGFDDIRGTLFFEYVRAIQEISPSVILAENVKGLEKHDEGRTLSTMLSVLDDLGYRVIHKVLRSQYLDVPQKRERLVIMGVKKSFSSFICLPKEKDYTVSLREAFKDIPFSEGQKYSEAKYDIMRLIPPGGYWRDLPFELQKKYMGRSFFLEGGKTGMARRLSWDEPSLTLTCHPAQKQTERCHPSETRPLTIREYARLQCFPDHWCFSGSLSSQYKQIGNAVPVNLGYHLGRCLIGTLSQTYDPHTMDIL